MSTKWHFKNNAAQARNYRPLDTNPADYGSNSNQQNQYQSQNNYKEGVLLSFIDGSHFKTSDFNVDDVFDALNSKEKWLKLQNGGGINLDYLERYVPFKFFDSPKPGFRGGRVPYRNNYRV